MVLCRLSLSEELLMWYTWLDLKKGICEHGISSSSLSMLVAVSFRALHFMLGVLCFTGSVTGPQGRFLGVLLEGMCGCHLVLFVGLTNNFGTFGANMFC